MFSFSLLHLFSSKFLRIQTLDPRDIKSRALPASGNSGALWKFAAASRVEVIGCLCTDPIYHVWVGRTGRKKVRRGASPLRCRDGTHQFFLSEPNLSLGHAAAHPPWTPQFISGFNFNLVVDVVVVLVASLSACGLAALPGYTSVLYSAAPPFLHCRGWHPDVEIISWIFLVSGSVVLVTKWVNFAIIWA